MASDTVDEAALGMIETRGVVAALEAADAMAKMAGVSLIGQSYAGGGITTYIEGKIDIVRSAIDTGAKAANKVGDVITVHVIQQPHQSLRSIVESLCQR